MLWLGLPSTYEGIYKGPLSGYLFLFCNGQRNRLKVLAPPAHPQSSMRTEAATWTSMNVLF